MSQLAVLCDTGTGNACRVFCWEGEPTYLKFRRGIYITHVCSGVDWKSVSLW